jgi:hypothetical protein
MREAAGSAAAPAARCRKRRRGSFIIFSRKYLALPVFSP